jgi:predicted nucleotidyltransferase
MNVSRVMAAAGLLALACGMLLVNIVPTPRAAQAGTIMASCGVALLAALAIRQLLF